MCSSDLVTGDPCPVARKASEGWSFEWSGTKVKVPRKGEFKNRLVALKMTISPKIDIKP